MYMSISISEKIISDTGSWLLILMYPCTPQGALSHEQGNFSLGKVATYKKTRIYLYSKASK